jgi:hypothetical protein
MQGAHQPYAAGLREKGAEQQSRMRPENASSAMKGARQPFAEGFSGKRAEQQIV